MNGVKYRVTYNHIWLTCLEERYCHKKVLL